MTTDPTQDAAYHADQQRKQIEENIHEFLDQHHHKELLRFVAVGSVDDGKSTLIGRLLHDTNQVYDDQLEDARKGNTDEDQEIDFALLTDGLRAEREQGITIDVAYRYFHTAKRKFIIADTPGHVQYTRNMATGASTADVAIILIDARYGVQQQSRRHAYIASLLGIPHLTVCINKLDLEDYNQEVFSTIKSDFQAFADQLRFQDVHFLPISAKFGDNVVNRSEHTPWYDGPTLLSHLETVPLTETRNLTHFRFPVQYVLRPHQDYRGFAGQIASGVIRKGDPITVLPSGKTSRVKSIDTYEGSIDEAFAPMSVTLCLEDEVDVSRGDMLIHSEQPASVNRSFDAMLVWMNEKALDPAQPYLIKHTTQIVRTKVDLVHWKSDPNTLEALPADHLALNEIGNVRFTCHRPLYFDPYNVNRGAGAFILIHPLTNETLAAGMIQSEARDEAHQTPQTPTERWEQFHRWLWADDATGTRLDLSQMKLTQGVVNKLTPGIKQAIQEMHALEAGDIANPDEERMVGHYWLRDPERAPNDDIRQEILHAKAQIKTFVEAIHNGTHKPPHADKFKHLLLVGIGGSALGPQWIDHALTSADAPMKAHYFDNTDPDGMARILDEIGAELNATLVVVISKSGGTKETRNGMLTAERAFEAAGLAFGPHAVAVTGVGSKLAQTAIEKGFIGMFPMWDWVGGRTSLFSAVGLLPAGLLGIDTDALLAGAAAMDELTRRDKWKDNPAAWLAIAWWHATNGRAERAMALLPYKDRLLLFGRYSQQLIMESLGKQLDRNGQLVHQGLTVYGNKGSTDQHALVQQLREGPDDFFAAFIEVLQDREDGQPDPEVEPGLTSGDYLLGFLLGTREALRESGKRSFTLTLPNASPHSLGMLVALFERTVGLYASLLDINAYHQPGVEAGKRAATGYLALQSKALEHLQAHPNTNITLLELATALGVQQDIDALYYLLQHLTANGRLESIHHQIPTYLYKK